MTHSSGTGNDALATAVFGFFSKCKLRCADTPPFNKDDIVQKSQQLGWAGLVVLVQVAAAGFCSCRF